jgi:hypothetical protein
MEKTMKLLAVSEKKQREMKRQDGTVKMIDFYEVTMTDGIDTIHGETSENLTALIATTNEELKVHLVVGHLYMVRFNINARKWEKDGKKGMFVSINIHQMYHLA